MNSNTTDFEKIINGCLKHDAASRKQLYELFSKKMFSICQRYSKSKSDAEDIFQDAFLKVYKNIHQVKSPVQLAGWIRTIFVNTSIDFYKKELKNAPLELSAVYEFRSTENSIYDQLTYDEFLLLIDKLPLKMRIVFNLYSIEGYSHQEIAEQLDISIGTSKSNLHDAKKRLQELIANSTKEKIQLKSINIF